MKTTLLALGFISLSAPALANPISFSGAEIAALPNVSFPTSSSSIDGSSLLLGAEADRANSVLINISLDEFIVDLNNLELRLDLVRLLRDDGAADQNLFVYISDGSNLLGGVFPDNSTSVRFEARPGILNTGGENFSVGPILGASSFLPVSVGSAFSATLSLQAQAGNTVISGRIDTGSATDSATQSTTALLNQGNGLSLILGHNTLGENFQINALTFTNGVSFPTTIPEPGAMGGLGLALFALGTGLHRRRNKRAI